jgi:hypothetical protein
MCMVTGTYAALGHGAASLTQGRHITQMTSSLSGYDVRARWIAPAVCRICAMRLAAHSISCVCLRKHKDFFHHLRIGTRACSLIRSFAFGTPQFRRRLRSRRRLHHASCRRSAAGSDRRHPCGTGLHSMALAKAEFNLPAIDASSAALNNRTRRPGSCSVTELAALGYA